VKTSITNDNDTGMKNDIAGGVAQAGGKVEWPSVAGHIVQK